MIAPGIALQPGELMLHARELLVRTLHLLMSARELFVRARTQDMDWIWLFRVRRGMHGWPSQSDHL
jgi:hypothetical protein